MKKIIISALALFVLNTANAQLFVNGDINHDGNVSLVDVNTLVDMLMKQSYATPESLIAGTWKSLDGDVIVLNADGTTEYGGSSTFKYKAVEKVLNMYDANGIFTHVYNIIEQNDAYMTLKSLGQSENVTYYNTKIQLPTIEEEVPKIVYVPDPFKGHEYVDFGLPSGTLWATTNVGQISPDDYTSALFAWGETSTDWKYDKSNYQFTNVNHGITDDCCENGVLLPEFDAATVAWGEEWCTPTKEQIDELVANCTQRNLTLTGPNGKEITIYSNYQSGEKLIAGTYIWSSTLANWETPYEHNGAYVLNVLYGNMQTKTWDRYLGLAVRPVLKKKKNEL